MANYYNVTGYKHTGFNTQNRPFSRELLESEEFTSDSVYCQVKGIALNRQAMKDITSIDLQGSVKDLQGEQINPPNATGSQPVTDPWYNWEEVDYIRLSRTGYPGDPDYVDISGNMRDPWNADTGGRKHLRVAYYWVTDLEPLARDVTRLYLKYDAWTSCGASDELEIETGFKIRGMITDAEDASSYNLASEEIGCVEPLITVSGGSVAIADDGSNYSVVATSANLTEYTQPDSITGILATATNGQTLVFPEIKANTVPVTVNIDNGLGDSKKTTIKAYGYFDYDNDKIANAVSVLYSAGVLEMRDSVLLPKCYIDLNVDSLGQVVIATNKVMTLANPSSQDIGSYPRKADYLFGQEVLFSKTSGSMNVQGYTELTDRSVQVWAIPTTTGTPYARYKGIKQHAYGYDQAVQGTSWQKSSIVLEGASGSTFTQLNAQYAQQSLTRTMAQTDYSNQSSIVKNALGVAQTVAGGIGSFISGKRETGSKLLEGDWAGAVGSQASTIGGIISTGFNLANKAVDIFAQRKARDFTAESLQQQQNQLITDSVQQSLQAPNVNFVPDLNGAIINDNGFYCYTVNTSAKDRERLKNYFNRFGYNGLYKPLTYAEINVKKRVNFVQAEGVCLKHKYYAERDLYEINDMFARGVWLWNERPTQTAFSDNPDN